jgi:type IV pilus assembly protein PilA
MPDSIYKNPVRGFTLIELLIALGIVAILVALAVPAYKDYTIRSKITECVNEAAVAKVTISEYRQTLGAWPPDLEGAGLTLAGVSQFCGGYTDYVASSGAFAVDVNEAAIDPQLATIAPVLTPYLTLSGMVNWICTRGTTDEDDLKYLPSTCRGA